MKIEGKTKMQNELVKQDTAALTHFAAVAAAAQELRLLKFVKGKYYTGDDEVPIGRQYIAHMNQLNHGWVKFEDGKVTEQRVGLVAEGFNPSKREELDSTDESQWEKDSAGKPRDPWTCQYYLALEDVDSGELVTFVTGTAGGNSAIGRLCGQFVRNANNGQPIVRLGASSYKHKSYGRVEVPDFPVVGWTGLAHSGEAAILVPAARDDMDEEIPF
jgi:hypothetical protein